MKVALLILALVCPHPLAAQTFTVQGGASLSHGLGDSTGPVIEGRVALPWLYTRLAFAGTPKAYLGAGNVLTGDLCAAVPYRGAWFGGGIELARARTPTYGKTAMRLLLGGGWRRGAWELAGFAYPPEWGTPNRSYGARGEVTWARHWLAVTVRAFVQHHHDSLLPVAGVGGGVDLLVGVRWGHVR